MKSEDRAAKFLAILDNKVRENKCSHPRNEGGLAKPATLRCFRKLLV